MSEDRKKIAIYIKTVFGLATGSLRNSHGPLIAAANAISAVEVGANLMLEGLLKEPKGNFSEREDFQVLTHYASKMDSPEVASDYVKTLTEDEVSEILFNAESFYMDIISDTRHIPMNQVEKVSLMKQMKG